MMWWGESDRCGDMRNIPWYYLIYGIYSMAWQYHFLYQILEVKNYKPGISQYFTDPFFVLGELLISNCCINGSTSPHMTHNTAYAYHIRRKILAVWAYWPFYYGGEVCYSRKCEIYIFCYGCILGMFNCPPPHTRVICKILCISSR